MKIRVLLQMDKKKMDGNFKMHCQGQRYDGKGTQEHTSTWTGGGGGCNVLGVVVEISSVFFVLLVPLEIFEPSKRS